MPPTERFVISFAAEPPQDAAPYGRWAETLRAEFLSACLRIDSEGVTLGAPGEIEWYPDRTYEGRTYVPATTRTENGFELFGHVSFVRSEDGDPADVAATADFTDETADNNPDWTIDLCDEELGTWRGEDGNVATMTLVWGRPTSAGGAVATAELANLAVDQCAIGEDGRFTLVAADNYRRDTLEVAVWDRGGRELARESLYEDDGEDDDGESAED